MINFKPYVNKILIMGASGILTIVLAAQYKPSAALHSEASVPREAITAQISPKDTIIYRFTEQWKAACSELASVIQGFGGNSGERAAEPSVLKFNLISLYPEEDESGRLPLAIGVDGAERPGEYLRQILEPVLRKVAPGISRRTEYSYGGKMFDYINRKDAEWTSQIYRWLQTSPEQAALRLGLGTDAVKGGFDPTNPAHKEEDPATWLIPSWKNVVINFYDGDGRQITLRSNTKEIISMANVATYYTGWNDVKNFQEYADALWNASHSFSVRLGEVYYCEGCTLPEETLLEETGLRTDGMTSAKTSPPSSNGASGPAEELNREAETAAESAGENKEIQDPAAQTAAAKLPAAAEEAKETDLQEMTQPQNTAGTTSAAVENAAGGAESGKLAAGRAGIGNAAEAGAESGDGNPPAEAAGAQTETAAASLKTAENEQQTGQAEASSTETAKGRETAPAASRAAFTDETAQSGEAAETQPGQAGEIQSGETADSRTALDGLKVSQAGAQTGADEKDPAAAAKPPALKLNQEGEFCPGHVDLTITARITGLAEGNNLFRLDRKWDGWTPYTKKYAEQMMEEEWKAKYGLDTMELVIGTPLTLPEIKSYLALMPPDISAERRAVVTFALNSVGKIPYYFGGKAHAPGYENNTFSAPARPDTKGRILSGLDCSGWVNWVYWTVTGNPPTAFGTSGLSLSGKGIGKSQLKPGDILVKPGSNSHVVMFIGWAADGSMVCVHETGGVTNNVTVSYLRGDWPYYRSLLD